MDNFKEIKGVQGVFIRGAEIVIAGCPEEDDAGHNCDEMCCGSLEHIIFRGSLCLMKKGYSEEKQEAALGGGGEVAPPEVGDLPVAMTQQDGTSWPY